MCDHYWLLLYELYDEIQYRCCKKTIIETALEIRMFFTFRCWLSASFFILWPTHFTHKKLLLPLMFSATHEILLLTDCNWHISFTRILACHYAEWGMVCVKKWCHEKVCPSLDFPDLLTKMALHFFFKFSLYDSTPIIVFE